MLVLTLVAATAVDINHPFVPVCSVVCLGSGQFFRHDTCNIEPRTVLVLARLDLWQLQAMHRSVVYKQRLQNSRKRLLVGWSGGWKGIIIERAMYPSILLPNSISLSRQSET
jgi:hypothetical protein